MSGQRFMRTRPMARGRYGLLISMAIMFSPAYAAPQEMDTPAPLESMEIDPPAEEQQTLQAPSLPPALPVARPASPAAAPVIVERDTRELESEPQPMAPRTFESPSIRDTTVPTAREQDDRFSVPESPRRPTPEPLMVETMPMERERVTPEFSSGSKPRSPSPAPREQFTENISPTNAPSMDIAPAIISPSQAKTVVRDNAVTRNETAVEHARKHQDPMYVCPMHPGFTSANPNDTCPICGMKVVPLDISGEAEVVKLSPTVVNSLGVRTEKVTRRNLFRKINNVGIIDYDQNKMRSITLRTEAWVEKLRTKSVGETVRRGDVLFDAYAPTLVSAQEEYLNALQIENGDGQLTRATAQRLAAFGFSQQQIGRLRAQRKVEELLTFYAPFAGIVAELNVREGGYIAPSTPVMVLADLSTVWLMVDVFESQVGLLQKGLQAEASLPFLGDKTLQGMVDYVYPTVDPKTRTVKVRVIFENKDGMLKPNMYANVTIYGEPRRKVLSVAREAIIRVGNRSRVIVALGDGSFKPVPVMVGVEADDRVEITGGIDENAEVVVSSQFLIDSESSVRAAMMRMGGL